MGMKEKLNQLKFYKIKAKQPITQPATLTGELISQDGDTAQMITHFSIAQFWSQGMSLRPVTQSKQNNHKLYFQY